MSHHLRRLLSLPALVGWLPAAAKVIWKAVSAASNIEFVKVHILSTDVWTLLASNSTALTVVFGVVWLTAVLLRPQWFEWKRHLAKASETIVGKQYFHETIRIDGRRFEKCSFVGCHFEYYGLGDCSFSDDCTVTESYFIITHDPVSNAFENANRKLHELAGPAIRIPGKKDTRTGQFIGPIADWISPKKSKKKKKKA